MKKNELKINNIPAMLWGDKSDRLFVAVHGNMSNKEDNVIAIFAEEAATRGYQILSFDLPEHGERKNENYPCKVQNCVDDLGMVMEYARPMSDDISLFACSMGAYFSLLAYRELPLSQCLLLSPVVNMERIIDNMMKWFEVSEERLEKEKEIATPIGQTLYWDYYSYVKDHPVNTWDKQTSILYGSKDEICAFDDINDFTQKFHCDLTVMEGGEHYFHTEEQLSCYRKWLSGKIGNP